VVALDTTVPHEDFGALSEETVDFLIEVLASAAPEGTVLALHHPPISSPIEPMAKIALRQPQQLAALVANRDVRLVLCGHNHREQSGLLASIPVWVSPALAYRADVTSTKKFRGLAGSAFSRIDIDEHAVTVAAVSMP
jgi:Icc protein